jgi:hypothetical protein
VPWSCAVKPSTVITCPNVNDTECQIKPASLPCDDGDPCTLETLCKGGICINPNVDAQKPCDDANPCTDDSCDPKLGRVNVANKAPCDAGDACTESDACAGKLCASGSPDDAYLSSCDHTTAGGGWTRFSESWAAEDVNKLLDGKGQVLRRCGGASLSYVASPLTSTPWSWAKKAAVAGTWTADGKAIAYGADASFSALPCGSGWGCANAPGAGAPSLLSGMTGPNACSTPSAAATTGPLSVCGKDNWATWELYGRAAP